jgi:hypothetical protein
MSSDCLSVPRRYAVWVAAALLATLCVLPADAQQAKAQTFSCPERLDGISQELQNVPAGWTKGKEDIPIWLAGITLFDGPIEERVALVPDADLRAGAKVQEQWDLNPKETPPLWLQCRYANTIITLAKPLGAGFRQCTATYNPQIRVAGQMAFEKLSCR